MKDTTIKDQQQTIERLQNELKEKSDLIFALTDTLIKKDIIMNEFIKSDNKRKKKIIERIKDDLILFRDPYFKGLTIEQIIKLAKKSIRLTDDNCKMRHKLEDIADLYDDSEYAKEIKKIICRED